MQWITVASAARQLRNIVVLDEDVARAFKDSRSVNAALREIARIAENYAQQSNR